MNGARLRIIGATGVDGEGSLFVQVSFLPDRDVSARTAVASRDGDDGSPQWDEMIRLKPSYTATAISLQLFKEGMFNSELLGSCDIDFSDYPSLRGARKVYALDKNGGTLIAEVTMAQPGQNSIISFLVYRPC